MDENDKRFNLLDEPWILVRKKGCEIAEVSLADALLHAHEYDALSGELPTQDIAILRLLLAVLHTVFSRVDADGEEITIDTDNAVEVWSELWENGRFPEKPIRDYLDKWHERFWLFHPERPFFQVRSIIKNGTSYTSAKLNGEISESNNKARLFTKRIGNNKERLTISEAARWLIYINSFDDTAVHPKECGVGWLGKLGLIYASGNNLFETLTLNLILLGDGEFEWDDNNPVWESKYIRESECTCIPCPNNLAELYTLQSRRLLLNQEGDYVTGYVAKAGDYFNEINAFAEQMTIWNHDIKNYNQYKPQRHDYAKQLWREFASIAGVDEDVRLPGIINWIFYLMRNDKLPDDFFCCFNVASLKYGMCRIDDVFSDSLTFNIGILTDAGIDCRILIENEIRRCDKLADIIADFAEDLMRAAGEKEGHSLNAFVDFAKEQYYYRIDGAFRKWMLSVNPSQTPVEREDKRKEWRKINLDIICELGRELAASQGQAAFVGRDVEVGKGKTKVKRHYSVPEAQNRFIRRIKHVDE